MPDIYDKDRLFQNGFPGHTNTYTHTLRTDCSTWTSKWSANMHAYILMYVQRNSQPKSVGLVWGLTATRRSVCIRQMNRMNSRSDRGHEDSSIIIIVELLLLLIINSVHLRDRQLPTDLASFSSLPTGYTFEHKLSTIFSYLNFAPALGRRPAGVSSISFWGYEFH